MNGLKLATCDVALPMGGALPPEGDAPEWVHLLPNGPTVARDGRKFDLGDPAAVILAFEENGADLPIDYEHQSDRAEANLNGPVPAAGWITALAANESGLWGKVEWTATARDMIRRKEYRYLSPSILHNKAGQVMRLKGAGLVHRPALHLKALASEEDTMPPDAPTTKDQNPTGFPQRLAKLLGLGPDASEDDVIEALAPKLSTAAEATPDPRKFVPVEAVAELLQDRNSRIATMNEQAAHDLVEKAFDDGYLTPAMRGWATSLAKEDPDSFRTFLAKSPRPFANFFKPLPRAPFETIAAMGNDSNEAAAICSQLGLKPGSLNS
ncbi:phage protease [Pseudorhodobacter sp.]|uniref:phage protease n=1 Tax=Pseudorhodobacter sp. TaxID=1934400 RepID=UPI002AFF2157|nr:phage protease [Pseudorhodobacter sp.]